MARRRRAPSNRSYRRKRNLVIAQLLVLGLILMAVIFFRDTVSTTATSVLGFFGPPDDLRVPTQKAEEEEVAPSPAPRDADAGAP